MIRFENYKKHFGDHLILTIPKLELAHNIYWLKGENGAGKTTLIKSLAGLIPFDGLLSLANTDIRINRMTYKRAVNYAEAEPLYPGFLSGSDLVRFYAKTKNADEKQVASLMDAFGIGAYVNNKTGTYSSGMSKKLSLVLGFMGNPKLILLDEPLITLDVHSVTILREIIEQYYKAGVTFIITSHQELSLPDHLPAQLLVKDKTLSIL